MSIFLYAYNAASEGAKELSSFMGVKRIKHENSNFKGSSRKIVINWGFSGNLPDEVKKCLILNDPSRVSMASNKLSFFRNVPDDVVPPWTESFDKALEWIANGKKVCARTVLNGHSAEGLVVMDGSDTKTFVKAPLYTQYIPKKNEYRVHVVRGEVIDVQKKVLRQDRAQEAANGGPPINWQVRNLANGFIYQRNNITIPECVKQAAIKVMSAIGLDFGGVDIIYRNESGTETAYVLEINTAPGISGTTVENYSAAFNKI